MARTEVEALISELVKTNKGILKAIKEQTQTLKSMEGLQGVSYRKPWDYITNPAANSTTYIGTATSTVHTGTLTT